MVPIVAPTNPGTKLPDGMGGEGFSLGIQCFYTQVVLTFVFVSVILVIKDVRKAGTNAGMTVPILQALAVVGTLYGCIQAASHTGAGFNPAISIGQWLLSLTFLENTNHYLSHYIWCFTLGPALGGIIAGIFHHMVAGMTKQLNY